LTEIYNYLSNELKVNLEKLIASPDEVLVRKK